MRDNRNNKEERPNIRLLRGADGRLRSANDGSDIGDVWAEQKRIRLAEAIQEDEKKAEKKSRLKGGLLRRAKAFRPKVKVDKTAKASVTPKAASGPAPSGKTKEVVVTLSVPKVSLPKLRLPSRLAAMPRKRLVIISGAVLLGSLAIALSFSLYTETGQSPQGKKEVASESITKDEHPAFDTVLPSGKNIHDLGGWARVSPQDKDPVFAFIDAIGTVTIRVSQQPLPKDLQTSTYTRIEEIAKQFAANERVSVGDSTAYVGTSMKGPQSVVFVKDKLLILISSDSKIENEQWGKYIESLQ